MAGWVILESATSGSRTRAVRVRGECVTTRPPDLIMSKCPKYSKFLFKNACLKDFYIYLIYTCNVYIATYRCHNHHAYCGCIVCVYCFVNTDEFTLPWQPASRFIFIVCVSLYHELLNLLRQINYYYYYYYYYYMSKTHTSLIHSVPQTQSTIFSRE